VLILLILVGYLWLGTSKSLPQDSSATPTQQRCILNTCFSLEIAKTPAQRSQGLMFREKLDEKYGMVFIFSDSAKHPFWMKNTLIPLDMIRLDSGYKIVDIKQADPCKQDPCAIYTPVADANYVIELNQ
jgi:uncharacterized membrane protein (UPF0127 family)